ncbi:MAG TPA: MlaD family protein [Actinomycetota bacterium]|nr:MlaD family protein [Actinomycetota bacterium]
MRSIGLKLGVFTVFTIIVTFWLASVIGKLSPFDDSYRIKAVFTDATGVLNGDPVKIAGVVIGKVVDFEVREGEAHVHMEIQGEIELPENAIADIKFLNLLGQRVINIVEPEVPAGEQLGDGGEIPLQNTRPALDLSVVFNNLRPLIQSTNPEDINTVARAVLEVFEGREGDLAGILGNVGELTKTLADRDQRLARLVEDLDEVTKVLNGQKSNIQTSLSEFTQFMESLADLTPQLERTIDDLTNASSRFGSLIERNRINLERELTDLATLLDIVNDNLGPLDRIAQHLKEVLLSTARAHSYGKWYTLYVVNLCPEVGAFTGQPIPNNLECSR